MTATIAAGRADCPDHPGLATYSLANGFCTCGRAHREWPKVPAASHAQKLADELTRMLEAERARWIRRGAPAECVRPAGEAFGWRQGSGPCDCPPCLTRSAAAHEPMTDAGATV